MRNTTRLYLVRHGETVWNSEMRFQGKTDIPLSEKGKEEARLFGERFKNKDIDVIYSSPLSRAMETAKAAAIHKNLDVIPVAELMEINFGEWEGYTALELKELYGEDYVNFMKKPFENTFPGDGTMHSVMLRATRGIKHILLENDGKNILCVAHGGVIRLLLIELFNLHSSFYSKTWIDNTGVTVIDFLERGPLLLTLNDKSHLEKMKWRE